MANVRVGSGVPVPFSRSPPLFRRAKLAKLSLISAVLTLKIHITGHFKAWMQSTKEIKIFE
jgi:hypothetical protein